MSARDWHPGDEALLRVEVDRVEPVQSGELVAFVRPGGREQGQWVRVADLLPVPEPDEGAIERVRELLSEDAGFDPGGLVGAVTFDDLARRIVAALASPVQPGRSEAEIKAEALREAAEVFRSADRLGFVFLDGESVPWEAVAVHLEHLAAARVADTTDTEGGE